MSVTGFEGPEKIVEFVFSVRPGIHSDFRSLDKSVWDTILKEAACLILDKISNDYLDAYILSESSMFVYKDKIIVKTCGTTTLLMICPLINDLGKKLNMELQWVTYSRKNFSFPNEQRYPHQNFKNELNYLSSYFQGEGFILGPLTSDHWYFYVADYTPLDQTIFYDITINLWMYDMNENVASQFFSKAGCNTEQVTELSGISKIFPGSKINSYNFEPCGYSMNGLIDSNYWTIHVTPESHCSYASFETSVKLNSYTNLIQLVLSIFQPKRFTLSIFSDEYIMNEISQYPYDVKEFNYYNDYKNFYYDDSDRKINNRNEDIVNIEGCINNINDGQDNTNNVNGRQKVQVYGDKELKYYRTSSSSSDLSSGYICGVGNWYLASSLSEARSFALGFASRYLAENEGEL